MATIDPRLTKTFIEWSDYMNPSLEVYGPVGRVFSEDDWQKWGAALLSLPGIAARGAPNPYQFSDWKEWATRFNQTLNQGS